MNYIIKAQNLGIKFRLQTAHKSTLKGFIHRVLTGKHRESQNFWALRNISFELKEGQILGIIGNNGAGKSTLMRVLGGIYTPDEGILEVKGRVSTLLSLTAGFQGDLSGIENIYLNGVLMGFKESDIDKVVDDIIEFSELGKFAYQPVKTYSSGMYARLGFSIAAHLREDIVLMDEILGVGDASFRKKSQEKIKQMLGEHATFVIVSHSMSALREYADKVLWLDRGEMKAFGEPNAVINEYLGK